MMKDKLELNGRVWQNYEKEIADNDYYYVRSCIRQTFFPGAENIFLRILREKLHLNVYEDLHHTSCTGIGFHTDIVPLETIMTVVARQFALMTEAGYKNLLISCVTSFGIYCEVLEMWEHHPELETKVREQLKKATGREFQKPENLAHASDVIYKYRNEIAALAKYQLVSRLSGEPLRGVDHVGCHYAKIFPQHGIGGAEFTKVLSGVIDAFGANVVDYPERRHCCGFGFRQYILKETRGYSVTNARIKFESMAPFKPDFILTNCPGCNMFLDRWQYTLSEMEGRTYDDAGRGIPVLTHEELAALVLGYDPWEIGLQMHQVQPESLFEKIGIEYDADAKYKSKSGKVLPAPQHPDVLLV
jgi:heterodisulfide reductase subunit B